MVCPAVVTTAGITVVGPAMRENAASEDARESVNSFAKERQPFLISRIRWNAVLTDDGKSGVRKDGKRDGKSAVRTDGMTDVGEVTLVDVSHKVL